MENRKRNIQLKFWVSEEEKRLIDEKMKQLPIRQYGAYFRKMAIDGYILVVDRSDTKAYIRELQAVSRNINQIAKRANATGTVYQQDIEDIKKAVAVCVDFAVLNEMVVFDIVLDNLPVNLYCAIAFRFRSFPFRRRSRFALLKGQGI